MNKDIIQNPRAIKIFSNSIRKVLPSILSEVSSLMKEQAKNRGKLSILEKKNDFIKARKHYF